MAPKKPSAFMIFVFEWKEKNGPHMSIGQATAAAGAVWAKMDAKQREPYEQRKQGTILQTKKERLTSQGIPIEHLKREEREKERAKELMIKHIERTLRLAVDGKRLENQKFFFIMVNYFMRLMPHDIYVPAEIAIVEFSLKEGVSRKYHTLVNPNIDLFGNVYEAKQHSDNTHKLPLPPKSMGEDNMSKICTDILSFIMKNNVGPLPPLYTTNGAMGFVGSVLNFLVEESDFEENNLSEIKIYSLQELFYALKCSICDLKGTEKPRNRFVCDTILDKDVFEYSRDIACDYHEEVDRTHYCALSYVHRWSFTFVDYIITDLSIKLIPGCHMPSHIKYNNQLSEAAQSDHNDSAACGAMSILSINSKYESCNNSGTDVKKNSDESSQFCTQTSMNTTKQDYGALIDSINYSNDLTFNYWQRNEANESKAPDSRYLSLDFEEDFNRAHTSEGSRRRGRGRGIVIVDELNE